jgi:hypothetical protein
MIAQHRSLKRNKKDSSQELPQFEASSGKDGVDHAGRITFQSPSSRWNPPDEKGDVGDSGSDPFGRAPGLLGRMSLVLVSCNHRILRALIQFPAIS